MRMKKMAVLLLPLFLLTACINHPSPEPGAIPSSSGISSETESVSEPEQTGSETDPEQDSPEKPRVDLIQIGESQEGESEESTKDGLTGEWYTTMKGMVYCLSLSEDGEYEAYFDQNSDQKTRGSWEADGSRLFFEGDDSEYLIMKNSLQCVKKGMFFYRDKPEKFTPEEQTDTAKEDYNGYWTCSYVDVDGTLVSAYELGEDTDLYIENGKVALGGSLFGDVMGECDFSDGKLLMKLTDSEDSMKLQFELQSNGLLKLTMTENQKDLLILYLSEKVFDLHPVEAE